MNIDPVCFMIGSREIRWYGVMMALGFLASLGHWRLLGRRTGVDTAFTGDLLVWLMVAGVAGARAAYVLANWAYFRAVPAEILRVDQGGLIFYGGFLGAGVALVLFSRLHRQSLLTTTDLVVTALPLGHAFGRIGCFLNGCCGGRAAPAECALACGLAHYPVQLYESAFNLALYAFLFWYYLAPARRRPGRILALYLMTYPVGRFLLELLRGDERTRVGALDAAQVVSLALLATGLTLWTILRLHEHTHRSA
jgi:phosphatidylglycerol:prolipoprotein diacylglycerol transferase